MQERFTQRARRALDMAKREAAARDRLTQPEHILLALLLEGKGVAARVLARMRVGGRSASRPTAALDEVAIEFGLLLGPENRRRLVRESAALSEDAERVLTRAMAEAQSLGHDYVGTEHLLLALAAEAAGPAAEFFADRDLSLDELRKQTVSFLGGPGLSEISLRVNGSDYARAALAEAERAFIDSGESETKPAHIMWGMLVVGKGVAAKVLREMGIEFDSEELQEVRARLSETPPAPRRDSVQWREDVQSIFKTAVAEAQACAHERIGTGHLLLGFVAHPGEPQEVIENLGLSLDDVQNRTRQLLAGTHRTDSVRIAGLTDRARKVLAIAREEAQRSESRVILPAHVLVALVREGEGVAALVLRKIAPNLEKAPGKMKALIDRLAPIQDEEEHDFHSTTRRLLSYARQEADSLSMEYVGTEHILLAFLRSDDDAVFESILKLDLDPSEIRQQTIQFLDRQTPEAFNTG